LRLTLLREAESTDRNFSIVAANIENLREVRRIPLLRMSKEEKSNRKPIVLQLYCKAM
jgi:hypothetical protein